MSSQVFADLHIHSRASDGTQGPAEIVRRARDLGLGAAAIADHDTMEGVPEALEEGDRIGLDVIAAVEINTDSPGGESHILGYFLEPSNDSLEHDLRILRESRLQRAERMIVKLGSVGVELRMERVLQIAGHGSVGRPHVAQAIVEAGSARTKDEAFRRFLVRGAPGYVPRKKFDPADAIEVVRRAGGLAVIAHPEKVRNDSLVGSLVGAGLDGVEIYHVDHTQAHVRKWRSFVAKNGLLVTGGSDSHGPGAIVDVEIGSTGLSEQEYRDFTEGAEALLCARRPSAR